MDERKIARLLGQDLSEGTGAFRDALLARCLRALDEQRDELGDDELEMLAAAGDAVDTLPRMAKDR